MAALKAEILPPIRQTNSDRRKSRDGARALTRAGKWAFQPVREAIFVHAGGPEGSTPSVSSPFVTQHLDQEWVRPNGFVDPRQAANAYGRVMGRPRARARAGLSRLL